MLTVAEIYEKDPETWELLELEVIIKMLREEGKRFADAEALANATGSKIRTKKPSFTKGKFVQKNDQEAIADIEVEL